jgi:hypothetical protein
MRLVDFLDKGASLHPSGAPCLTMSGRARSYAEVQRLSWSAGRPGAGRLRGHPRVPAAAGAQASSRTVPMRDRS